MEEKERSSNGRPAPRHLRRQVERCLRAATVTEIGRFVVDEGGRLRFVEQAPRGLPGRPLYHMRALLPNGKPFETFTSRTVRWENLPAFPAMVESMADAIARGE